MSEVRSTWERSLKTFGILLLLVVFPLTSWYFLQSGLNFTKDKYDKLENITTLDSFVAYPLYGDSVTNRSLEGRMTMVSSFPEDERYLDSLSKLHHDLIDPKLVWIVMINTTADKANKALDREYSFILDSSAVKLIKDFRISEGYGLFETKISLDSNHLALIDTKGVVRYIYDLSVQEEMELLLSHLVLLLPKE